MKKIELLIDKASKLVNTVPLPDDAEDQLDKIIDQADNETEKFMLASYVEALFLQRHS